MSPERIHLLADWSSILTFVVTLIGAAVGVFGYVKYLRGLHTKSKRLEEYLRKEKAKQIDQGQRSIIQIMRDVGLTEDEIIQVSFRNPHVARRAKIRVSFNPTKSLCKNFCIAVLAAGADLGTTTDWIPRCVGPFDCRLKAHELLSRKCNQHIVAESDLTLPLGAFVRRWVRLDFALRFE